MSAASLNDSLTTPHHIIPGDGPLSTAGSGCDMTRLVASVCGHAKLTDNTVSSRGSANAHSCCYNHSTGFREKKWTDRMKTAGDKPREAVAFNQAILLSVMDKTGTGWCCCNLSGGVALNVWFTTNGKCVKNNTDIYVAWTSNKRVIAARDLYCCLLPQCEALRTCCSGFPIATKSKQNAHEVCWTVYCCLHGMTGY